MSGIMNAVGMKYSSKTSLKFPLNGEFIYKFYIHIDR